ncbi:hypothetical protein QQG55_5960 [Brugia pahangi]
MHQMRALCLKNWRQNYEIISHFDNCSFSFWSKERIHFFHFMELPVNNMPFAPIKYNSHITKGLRAQDLQLNG